MESLKGKIALVTGVGRPEGIGAAICQELAAHGADVFYTYWQAYDKELFPEVEIRAPEDLATGLASLGVRTNSVEMDLSDPGSARALFEIVRESLGEVDFLINNACHDIETPFLELTAQTLDTHYAINTRAITLLCKEFVVGRKKEHGGKIIILTSGQALGSMGWKKVPYTITKASAEMLAIQLAPELLLKGITINAVDPGPTDTGWMTEDIRQRVLRESSKGTITTPKDVASGILSILEDEAQPTGQVIRLLR